MLLTKTVIQKWYGKTRKWYENKGYTFTKRGDEFEVKIEDLSDGSHVLINVKCDNPDCTTPINKPIKWQSYIRSVHEDGKYYCQKCAHKLFGIEKSNKTRLKKSKSFEQWCIEHNRQDILERWDYELNNCSPKEISYSSNGVDGQGYWFKCLEHPEHKSESKHICSFTKGQEGSIFCNQCSSFAQYLIDIYGEDALNLYWDYEKNTINPWKTSYGSTENVWIKCQEKDYHGSSSISCSHFTSMNSRCSYCGNFKVHPLDSLGKLLEDKSLLWLWSDKNEKSPYEYMPMSTEYVWWKCLDSKHEDYYRSISNSNRYEFRCPECQREKNESILQEKVRLYLENLNNNIYTILHEYNCTIIPKNPKIKSTLPFDNEIKELKLIIEVHGIQHYELSGFHIMSAKKHNTTPEYELSYQKLKDRYKKFIAYKKRYNYIAIPYWTNDKEEAWKQLIDNKIKELI